MKEFTRVAILRAVEEQLPIEALWTQNIRTDEIVQYIVKLVRDGDAVIANGELILTERGQHLAKRPAAAKPSRARHKDPLTGAVIATPSQADDAVHLPRKPID